MTKVTRVGIEEPRKIRKMGDGASMSRGRWVDEVVM
jgi:hypothetical protein